MKERLERLKEELLNEFEKRAKDYFESFKSYVDGVREELIKDVDGRIKVIKELPVDPLSYDFIEVVEFEAPSFVNTLQLERYIPSGMWKFVVLGVRKREAPQVRD
ncbi:MAG: hypothetical protein QXK12_08685 [Candidatus Nezhaarchaeales archaeon]